MQIWIISKDLKRYQQFLIFWFITLTNFISFKISYDMITSSSPSTWCCQFLLSLVDAILKTAVSPYVRVFWILFIVSIREDLCVSVVTCAIPKIENRKFKQAPKKFKGSKVSTSYQKTKRSNHFKHLNLEILFTVHRSCLQYVTCFVSAPSSIPTKL